MISGKPTGYSSEQRTQKWSFDKAVTQTSDWIHFASHSAKLGTLVPLLNVAFPDVKFASQKFRSRLEFGE